MRFERARADLQVRCVILTGSGTTFCAGMDLTELQESVAPSSAQDEGSVVWQDALRLAQLFDLIYAFPKPTIAAVNGPAVAGGAGLTTVCDLAVASPGASSAIRKCVAVWSPPWLCPICCATLASAWLATCF